MRQAFVHDSSYGSPEKFRGCFFPQKTYGVDYRPVPGTSANVAIAQRTSANVAIAQRLDRLEMAHQG